MIKRFVFGMGMLGLVLVLSSQLALAQFGKMQGTVKDEDGNPYANKPVLIERLDMAGKYDLKTDKNGRFRHAGLPLGSYKITVTMQSGAPYSLSGIPTTSSDTARVDIDLQQEKMKAEAVAQGMDVSDQKGGLTPEQIAELQRVAAEREVEIQKRQALISQFDGAMEALKAKDYDGALAQLEAAAAADSTQHVVFAQMGEAYNGKAVAVSGADSNTFYEKAADSYSKAIAIKADDASYHNNYALALANIGKIPEAQAALEQAAELDPQNGARYFFNMGAVLINTGNTKEAAEAFRKSTEVDPNFADGYYQLGVTLTGLATTDASGKIIPAPGTEDALKKYLEVAPAGPNAAAATSLLEMMGTSVQTKINLNN